MGIELVMRRDRFEDFVPLYSESSYEGDDSMGHRSIRNRRLILCSLLALVFIFVLLCAVAVTAEDNIAPNPSFEANDGRTPAGWEFWLDPGAKGAIVGGEEVHSGRFAVRLTAAAGSQARLRTKQAALIPADEALSYLFEVWARGQGSNWTLSVACYNSQGKWIGSVMGPITAGEEWSLSSLSVKLKPGTAKIQLYIEGNSGASEPGDLYIDDVLFRVAGEGLSLNIN